MASTKEYPDVVPIPGSKNNKVTNRRRLLLQKPAEAAASFFCTQKVRELGLLRN